MANKLLGRFTTWRSKDNGNSDPPEQQNAKFGLFAGVFTPTVLTILGAIMYLRTGWVVGNAGLLGALAIILLAHVITVCTGLAVSSIATNTRVGAGGAFAIISQSLGLEVGGSVGIPLFLAQSISIALYVLAFAEAWLRAFPSHNAILVAILTYVVVFLIVYISTQFTSRTQFFILAIVAFSLFSIFLGSFPILGQEGFNQTPTLIGQYPEATFWETFAVFFPAVTGIMVGISMSGSLKSPRRDIPIGTMTAIFLTMGIYLWLAYWLSRVATPAELLVDSTIMVNKAAFGWAVLAGMLGATLSSALGSLVAAPRVMQALALHRVLPFSNFFAHETDSGEPRHAMYFAAVVGFIALLAALAGGGLDSIAGIITMFFLITYAMLNVVVLFEQTLDTVSFRPTLKIPRLVPLIGVVSCTFVMFLIAPAFSLVAVVVVLAIYMYLSRRHLNPVESDVRSGLFASVAEWAVVKTRQIQAAPERTWKPVALVPVTTTAELAGSYLFLRAMTSPKGMVHALGIYAPGQREKLEGLEMLTESFLDDDIYARAIFLEEEDFINGVRITTQVLRRSFFRPNILFLHLRHDSDLEELQQLVDKTAAYEMGIALLFRHPVIALGREQLINVWMSPQGPDWQPDLRQSNLDLAILLAYHLAQNWDGRINLCMAVTDAEMATKAKEFMTELITLTRLSGKPQVYALQTSFEEALAQAPRADLSIFGLPLQPDLAFTQKITRLVDASCVFVRDSGDESALA
ncbi:MAG: amino acid permease [Anaerolineales bacterium]|nr:amino acid permease [Anaerolineales bacterium]